MTLSDLERAKRVERESKGPTMAKSRPWYFYMARCADGSLYAGITIDPQDRVQVHNAGQGADYTARRRPVTLVYREAHPTKSAARRREMQVKRWRADKKEQLVRGFPSTSSG